MPFCHARRRGPCWRRRSARRRRSVRTDRGCQADGRSCARTDRSPRAGRSRGRRTGARRSRSSRIERPPSGLVNVGVFRVHDRNLTPASPWPPRRRGRGTPAAGTLGPSMCTSRSPCRRGPSSMRIRPTSSSAQRAADAVVARSRAAAIPKQRSEGPSRLACRSAERIAESASVSSGRSTEATHHTGPRVDRPFSIGTPACRRRPSSSWAMSAWMLFLATAARAGYFSSMTPG